MAAHDVKKTIRIEQHVIPKGPIELHNKNGVKQTIAYTQN